MADSHNEISGAVHGGFVVQARDIGQVIFSGQPPQALAGLPGNSSEFVGRDAELEMLMTMLDPRDADKPVLVTAIGGLAGVGKTTLAIRAAHEARENGWYPGGELFVDLRGYDASGPVDIPAALAAFLEELGVPREHIPAEQAAREALYRSRLSAHAESVGGVLVVLDNASSAGQVRPLLPAHAKNRALITSRHKLAELPGVRHFDLDVMDADQAVALLDTALRQAWPPDGRARSNDAATLAELCGYLPLALRIVAAILIEDETMTVQELIDELRDTSTRLSELKYGDSLAVHTAFELSYLRLNEDEQRMFRLLSYAPPPNFSVSTAAALAGTPETQARKLLRALRRAHMVESADRFKLHDLLRLYAKDLAAREDDDEAVTRLVDHYLETTTAAVNQLQPKLLQKPALLRFTSPQDALAWLDAEWTCLVNIISECSERGDDQNTRDLAFLLAGYFDLRKKWFMWTHVQQLALAATRRLGDRAGERWALNMLGTIARQLRDFSAALRHHLDALDIVHEAGDRYGEAVTLNNLGEVYRHLGQSGQALDCCTKALEIHREHNDLYGVATTLNSLGSIHRDAGNLQAAMDHDLESLRIHKEIGDVRGQAKACNNIGNNHRLLRRNPEAIESFRNALDLHRTLGDTYGEAQTMYNLGLAHFPDVSEHWRAASDAFDACGDDREAESIRRQLTTLGFR